MENIPKISVKTVIRTLAAALSTVNAVLIIFGKAPADISGSILYAVCSAAALIGSVIWIWWKDNDIKANTRLVKEQVEAINEMENSCEGEDPEKHEEIAYIYTESEDWQEV